jgi:lipopolysaccharide heptosyltransferase I
MVQLKTAPTLRLAYPEVKHVFARGSFARGCCIISLQPDRFQMQILLVKLSSIGDVVHTLPAAALLRRAFPDARISWVVERRASAIIKDSPVIDQLIELDIRAWRQDILTASTIRSIRTQLGQLRQPKGSNGAAHADIAIDFQGLMKSGLVAFASRATKRIGFETSDLREKASKLLLTEQAKTSHFTHVIDKNIALAHAAIADSGTTRVTQKEVSKTGYEFPIAISAEDQCLVESATEGHRPFAIINPGGGWSTKLWAPDRYAALADWLWGDCGLNSFVTYGPEEERLAQAVVSMSRSQAVRPLATTLKQFVALAGLAALFVGGDTGPLHLAAASAAPIVGLYGPTSPRRNGPFDSRDITVGRDLWCRADCHRRTCWHWECMDIPLNDVKHAVVKRLANRKEEKAD